VFPRLRRIVSQKDRPARGGRETPKAGGGPRSAADGEAAAPDGYTLMFTNSTDHGRTSRPFKKLPYDPERTSPCRRVQHRPHPADHHQQASTGEEPSGVRRLGTRHARCRWPPMAPAPKTMSWPRAEPPLRPQDGGVHNAANVDVAGRGSGAGQGAIGRTYVGPGADGSRARAPDRGADG